MSAPSDWFDVSRFMPHGMCLDWDPGLLSLMAGSDAIIAASYYSIPVALLYYAMRRPDVVFRSVLILFSAFILACGTTHALDVWTIWSPQYGAVAMVKAATAALSLTTAVVLWRLVPAALTIPSARDLERANDRLMIETEAHDQARIRAEELALEFEARVEARTVDLADEIVKRWEAMEMVNQTNALLSAVIGASPLGIVAMDANQAVTVWNPAAERIYGVAAAEAIGRACPGLPGAPLEPASAPAEALDGDLAMPQRLELKRRRPDGKTIDLIVSTAPLHTTDTAASGTLLTLDDVTERTLLEAKLRQSQKMEVVGRMTGGVAHDFNNLLAVILGNLELLREGPGIAPDDQVMLDEAIRATLRGATLTQQLLAYSRQQPLAPRTVSIQQLVADLVRLLGRALGARIETRVSLPDDLWQVRIDPNQLENALLNLAINARDAMTAGGTLTIEGENTQLDPSPGIDLAEVVAGDYVALTVSDTGSGMSKDVLDHALEPFFTTKPVGDGSGLGLSMVSGFVKQSGGNIKIYSEVGHGTSVRLFLPRADAEVETATAPLPKLPRGAGEVIMLVEDDDAVRQLAVRLLTSLGYHTIEASDAATAAATLATAPRIDLFLTDVVLPRGMNGPDLARQSQKIRPGLKIMFISGYTKNAILHNGVLDEGVHFLAKPFPKAELARKVRQALDEG